MKIVNIVYILDILRLFPTMFGIKYLIIFLSLSKIIYSVPMTRFHSKSTEERISSSISFTTKNIVTMPQKRGIYLGGHDKGNMNEIHQNGSNNGNGSVSASVSNSRGNDFKGDGTYYNPSVGVSACGLNAADTELVAAINAPQWGASANPNNSPSCGRCVKITGPNGTVMAKIIDKCPSCAYGSMDLSPTTFDKIANRSQGRVNITWGYC
ncbi:hypothetical protein K7432_001368 [Basidiobolus ranarum]|uniref:Barwin domain-containing protein n=1 Tax=Basidiobolus ranarum TaxID=34480 RepID=A0ABR2W9S2_9FUNG